MISNIFTTSYKTEEITPQIAVKFAAKFMQEDYSRLKMLEDYYRGHHAILDRVKEQNLSNIKIVTNYAAYIANFTSAFLVGEPVSYTAPDNVNIEQILTALKKADSSTQDSDLALDVAIYGRGYELVYMSSDEKPLSKLARLSPLCAFVVYDDTVEQKPVFGVYWHAFTDENNSKRYKVNAYTAYKEFRFMSDENFGIIGNVTETPHSFGVVPLIEYYNNGQRGGDFEQVISLIDADNLLQSDRINDKEQFVNALLALKGVTLGDNNDEAIERIQALKDMGILELPGDGADAAFLTRQFDENSIETLRMSIVNDIHKISCVPDMSDKNFAANVSGVAMKFKLIGLEQLTKVKERYFAEGLKYRLRVFQNILVVKGSAAVDTEEIKITFKRSLPVNSLEEAQEVNLLSGQVPQRLLLSRLSFVEDVEGTIAELEKEKQADIKNQQSMFMNTPINFNE